MTGLTIVGLKDRIGREDYTLTEAEAVDLFFLFPNLIDIEREEDNGIVSVAVSGLNLEFSIRD